MSFSEYIKSLNFEPKNIETASLLTQDSTTSISDSRIHEEAYSISIDGVSINAVVHPYVKPKKQRCPLCCIL